MHYLLSGVVLHQHKFTEELLLTGGFKNFKKVATPIPSKLKLSAHKETLLTDPTLYRSLTGKLNFLTN